MKSLRRFVPLLLLLSLLIGCTTLDTPVSPSDNTSNSIGENTDDSADPVTPIEEPEPYIDPNKDKITEAVWIGVGDIMMHMPQYPASYDAQQDRYVFAPFFEAVSPIIQEGDWSLANLETPIAGKELKYTGYPLFNAPPELAEALANAGFTMISTANNHSLDRNEIGVIRTLEALEMHGLIAKGTARSQEEADKQIIIEKNEIKMGFLSYTYGTNGIPIPTGKPYLVALIDEARMLQEIAALREAGADVITVALHFGTEYQYQPNEEQKRIARVLIEAGADIIAGSHPHVVQPYEIVTVTNEQAVERDGIILYSMGNFISNQRGDFKDYGIIGRIGIRKHHEDGRIEFTSVETIPTWVRKYPKNGKNHYRILPVEETLTLRNESGLSDKDYERLTKDLAVLQTRLQSMLP